MAPRPPLRAVTFDVTGTLVVPRDLGGEYARVLARHGVAIAPERLAGLVPEVWRELACAAEPSRDRFAAHPGGAPGFWRQALERVCARADAPAPSRFAAAELYERFAQPGAWRPLADLPELLDALAARGIATGVVANWDERLPRLLARFGLAGRLRAIVTSQEIGVEKPHPAIFAAALARLGTRAAETLHVGDRQLEDVEGAEAAGLSALRVDPAGGGDLVSVAELPARLEALG